METSVAVSRRAAFDPDQDGSAHARRPVRRWTLQVVVGTLALVMVGSAVWLLRHPDRTFEAGYGMKLERPVGFRILTVLEHGQTASPGTIDIESIEPHVTRDGAAVKVEYAICHLDLESLAADGVSSVGYGMPDRYIRRSCTRLVPAEGAAMRLGSRPGQELLVGVTTTRPGRSVIRRHRIAFREGWRRGTADIRATVVLKAR